MKLFLTILVGSSLTVAMLVSCASVAGAAQWLVNGSSLSGLTTSEFDGGVKFADKKAGIGPIACSLVIDGVLGPESHSEINEVLTLGHARVTLTASLLCKKEGICEESITDIEMAPEKLPWDGVLTESGGKFFNTVFNLGFWMSCLVLGLKVFEECSGTIENEVRNVTGGVELIGVATPNSNCTTGGSSSGEMTFAPGNEMKVLSGTLSVSK